MNWWLILFIALVFSNGLIGGFFIGWRIGRKYQEKIDNTWTIFPLEKEIGIELPLKIEDKENKDDN